MEKTTKDTQTTTTTTTTSKVAAPLFVPIEIERKSFVVWQNKKIRGTTKKKQRKKLDRPILAIAAAATRIRKEIDRSSKPNEKRNISHGSFYTPFWFGPHKSPVN